MGFIPIILFTLAFIFLWGIVNYNSLRKTRNEIAKLQEGLADITRKRKNAARELLSGLSIKEGDNKYIAILTKIADNPVIDKQNINRVLRHEFNHTRLTVELDTLSEMAGTGRYPAALIDLLSKLTTQIIEARPGTLDLLHSYRNMLTKPPSKFIAKLFGFGP